MKIIITENPLTIGKVIPSQIITVVEKTVILHCISMSPVQWWRKDRNGIAEEIVGSRQSYILVMKSVSLSQSGRYYCNGTMLNGAKFTSYGYIYIAGLLCMLLSFIS